MWFVINPLFMQKTTGRSSTCEVKTDLTTIYSKIKEKDTDDSLGDEGCMYFHIITSIGHIQPTWIWTLLKERQF
jgi:hypothetical protein